TVLDAKALGHNLRFVGIALLQVNDQNLGRFGQRGQNPSLGKNAAAENADSEGLLLQVAAHGSILAVEDFALLATTLSIGAFWNFARALVQKEVAGVNEWKDGFLLFRYMLDLPVKRRKIVYPN